MERATRPSDLAYECFAVGDPARSGYWIGTDRSSLTDVRPRAEAQSRILRLAERHFLPRPA
ncbi:MAG: hypothetical protein ABR583_12395 [Gaiellaceae bacterium]